MKKTLREFQVKSLCKAISTSAPPEAYPGPCKYLKWRALQQQLIISKLSFLDVAGVLCTTLVSLYASNKPADTETETGSTVDVHVTSRTLKWLWVLKGR